MCRAYWNPAPKLGSERSYNVYQGAGNKMIHEVELIGAVQVQISQKMSQT